MVMNVGVEYGEAEQRYQDAKSNEEKLLALTEMARYIPKHKGTEAARMELNKKIAKLRTEVEKQKNNATTKKGSGGPSLAVKKEGVGQIVLVGMPNSGKSWLFNCLTGLSILEANFPFSTPVPEKGMMMFENIQIQIVELPALVEGSSDGKANGNQIISLIRNADAIVLVVNSDNALSELSILGSELKKSHLLLNQQPPRIKIVHSKFPGLHLSGMDQLQMPQADFEEFLKSIGYFNADVLLEEPTTKEKILQYLDERIQYKPCLIVLCRPDQSGFLAKIKSIVGEKHVTIVENESQAPTIKPLLFQLLNKIRVFTKKPGKEADFNDPLILSPTSTVEDAAKLLHKDLAVSFKSAKVWGSAKFPGQTVPKEFVLADKDIVEFG